MLENLEYQYGENGSLAWNDDPSQCLNLRRYPLLRLEHLSKHNAFNKCHCAIMLPLWCITSHPLQNFHTAASLASLSARRCRFSNKLALRALKIACCLFSTPIIQYPKLAPAPAKTGYAHSDSLLKNGRISRPSCQKRTARP